MTRVGEQGAAASRLALGVIAGLVALVCVAFLPAFSADYVSWDDEQNFVSNTMWHGLSAENVRWMLTTFHLGHYQPLSWLSFGLQYEVFGAGPGPGHALNVLLHAANAVLMFFVIRWVLGLVAKGGSAGLVTLGAGLGAAFFAVHPLRVESVAWITERRDVLSTTLLLGALLAYGRAVAVGEARVRDWRWYWVSVVLVLLSCAAKAWGMSFFVVLMALDTYPLRRAAGLRGWFSRAGARLVAEKSPFVLIGAATALLAKAAQASGYATKTLDEWGVMERVVQACYGLAFYLRQTIAPSTHSPLYELPPEIGWEQQYVVPFILVAGLLGLAVWCWKRAPGVTVGLFIYLVQVSPVLGVLQSGEQFVADRYSYLATMPCAVGLAWVVVWMVTRAERVGGEQARARASRIGAVVSCLVLAGLMAATYAQTTVWKDGRTLWAYAAEVTPTSRVLGYYAMTLEPTDSQRALELYKRATEANPKDGRAWYAYANLVWAKGDAREAERAFLMAGENLEQAYMARQNLAIMYLRQGRAEEAVRQLELAIENIESAKQKKPDGAPYMQLGEVMLQRGERERAVALFRKALAYEKTRVVAEGKLAELGEK